VLDVKRLRLLVELSRRGTIAAVAQALSYSPSAVSQQLSVLEKEAGVALLEPVGRRVRLTSEGELLVSHAQRILRELEQASTSLEAAAGTVEGTVRMAAFQSAVLTLMPPALIALQTERPALRVELSEMEPEQSLPALAAGDFDIVLAEEYPNRPQPRLMGVTREDLVGDDLELVAPARWGPSSIEAMATAPFAMEPRGTPAREWAEGVCRQAGFEPNVAYTSTDLQIHLRMVDSALAAALMPRLAGADRYRGVQAWPLPGLPTRRVFAAVRQGSAGRPAVKAVIEAIKTTSPVETWLRLAKHTPESEARS
jgi:DNA-binding transcriptional LysR family regulator